MSNNTIAAYQCPLHDHFIAKRNEIQALRDAALKPVEDLVRENLRFLKIRWPNICIEHYIEDTENGPVSFVHWRRMGKMSQDATNEFAGLERRLVIEDLCRKACDYFNAHLGAIS